MNRPVPIPIPSAERTDGIPFPYGNSNPLNKGVLTENAAGIGPVTPEMIAARGRELAFIAGHHPGQGDYDQAQRELTGEPDLDRQETLLEAIPDSNPREAMPDSDGHRTLESASEDEDDEGHSASAQLVEEGMKEAEHDQRLRSAEADNLRDRSEG